jgi:hypothetical protein
MGGSVQPAEEQKAPLRAFLLYFLRLGTFGFGGPIALASRMESELVQERGWIQRGDYLEGLAFAQLSPGPLAAQLAMYLGYVRAGVLVVLEVVADDQQTVCHSNNGAFVASSRKCHAAAPKVQTTIGSILGMSGVITARVRQNSRYV